MNATILKAIENVAKKIRKLTSCVTSKFRPPLSTNPSPEEITNFQRNALRQILEKASKTSFYSKKFRTLGTNLQEVYDIKNLENLLVTGDDLRLHRASMRNPSAFFYFVQPTSGTGGRPLEVDVTLKQMINVYPIEERTFRLLGMHPKDSLLFILHRGAPSYYMALASMPLTSHNMDIADYKDLNEQIAKMRGKDIVVGYPTPLLRLAQHPKIQEIAKDVRLVIYGGEPLSKEGRKILEESFDAEVRSYYGSVEVFGPIGWTCSEGRFHMVSDYVLLQQDENNNAIITCLDKDRGTILIRYAGLKDKVWIYDDKCPCGSNFPSFELKGSFRHLDGLRIADAIYNSDAFKNRIIGPYFDFTMGIDPERGKRVVKIKLEKLKEEANDDRIAFELTNIIIHGSGELPPSKPLQGLEDMLEFEFEFVSPKQVDKMKAGGLRRGFDVN